MRIYEGNRTVAKVKTEREARETVARLRRAGNKKILTLYDDKGRMLDVYWMYGGYRGGRYLGHSTPILTGLLSDEDPRRLRESRLYRWRLMHGKGEAMNEDDIIRELRLSGPVSMEILVKRLGGEAWPIVLGLVQDHRVGVDRKSGVVYAECDHEWVDGRCSICGMKRMETR